MYIYNGNDEIDLPIRNITNHQCGSLIFTSFHLFNIKCIIISTIVRRGKTLWSCRKIRWKGWSTCLIGYSGIWMINTSISIAAVIISTNTRVTCIPSRIWIPKHLITPIVIQVRSLSHSRKRRKRRKGNGIKFRMRRWITSRFHRIWYNVRLLFVIKAINQKQDQHNHMVYKGDCHSSHIQINHRNQMHGF